MKLYFAGPLFTAAERAWNAEVAAAVRACGHEVFLPQEQERGRDAVGIFAGDVAGIDWADAVVGIMDGPDPDSGTSWEVGYAYGRNKSIVLVRTDIRLGTGSAGTYNAMLTESATERIDLPGGSTTDVADAILVALGRLAAGRRSGRSRVPPDRVAQVGDAVALNGESRAVEENRGREVLE
jgi:nucleoside 2-deoxyribosyltransferase